MSLRDRLLKIHRDAERGWANLLTEEEKREFNQAWSEVGVALMRSAPFRAVIWLGDHLDRGLMRLRHPTWHRCPRCRSTWESRREMEMQGGVCHDCFSDLSLSDTAQDPSHVADRGRTE